jgi:hypothetical protein
MADQQRGRPVKAHLVHEVPREGWHAWQSSNVIGGNWRGGGVLWIRFKNSFYAYSGVPEEVWRGLLAASSKGTYHARHIKNKYPFAGPIAA